VTETRILRALLIFSVLALAAWFLAAVRQTLAPFFLAGLLAFILSPLVRFLELRGIRRHSAVALLFLLLAAASLGLLYWAVVALWHDLPRLRQQLPAYADQLRGAASAFQAALAEQWPWVGEKRVVETLLQSSLEGLGAGSSGGSLVSTLAEWAFYAALIPFVTYFLLRGGREFFQRLLDACPGRWVEKFLSLIFEVDETLGNYLRAVLLEALAVGALSTAGLLALGVDKAALIGALSGLGNIVPYLGPVAGGVVGAASAFFQFQSVAMPLKVLALFAGIQFVDNWILQPVIMKRSVDLHPVTGLFALLAGGQVAGFWGLVLAVPLVCVLQQLFKIFSVWYLSHTRAPRLPREIWAAAGRPWIV
jgi:predicted PurR-regulated permease PerM